MGCATCSSSKDGAPSGCGNNGHCQTGGCNKMNTFDWLSNLDIYDPTEYNLVEVSFKKGARKDFFKITNGRYDTGDTIIVDAGSGGYNVGNISLSGELVRLQIKKKKIPKDRIFNRVIRSANPRDIEKLNEARLEEKSILTKARVIARTLDLDMKVGDVEFQGDKKKITFYYTAEGRIDFRELVRNYAKEFRVKIEMRQIGSRQESARIGGIGSCGRELCCSTWLSDFRSVSTAAARYQNIAINQTKLSGQCGRLKCCLNYELDTYMTALATFPKRVDFLKTEKGDAHLIKTDIFKGIMYYGYSNTKVRGPMVPLPKERVALIKEMNRNGEKPDELLEPHKYEEEVKELEFADVTGQIELPVEKRRRGKKRRSGKSSNRGKSRKPNNRNKNQGSNQKSKSGEQKSSDGNRSKKSTQNQKSNQQKSNQQKPNQKKSGQQKSGQQKSDNTAKNTGNRPSNNKKQSPRKPSSGKPPADKKRDDW